MLLSQRKRIFHAGNSTLSFRQTAWKNLSLERYLHPRGAWKPTLGSAWGCQSTRNLGAHAARGTSTASKRFADSRDGSSLGMLRCLGCFWTLLQRMPALLRLQTRCSWLKKLQFPGGTRATFKNCCEISVSVSV